MRAIRRRRRWLAAGAAGIVGASLCAPTARADFIVDRELLVGVGLVSSFFSLTPSISIAEIDSFTTTTVYRLGTLTAFASSDGGGTPISVSGSIYSGAPPGDAGAELAATAFGTLDADHNVVVDFGGALLPAGTYFLTAFVTRETNADGIWFWNTTLSGPEALAWQIGRGLAPEPESSVFPDPPLALAYTLTGTKVATAVPEPPSWALLVSGFAFAGLLSTRRRLRRREP